MSVAKLLGVDDPASAPTVGAREAWRQWCVDNPTLAVVPELDGLPAWTVQACGVEKNAVLAQLAELTAYDSDAAVVLAWLLVPGVTRIAAELGDLHPDVDGLVAGQLWIEVTEAHRLRTQHVAATILARTRREVAAELGVGDVAKRRDRIWAEAVRIETLTT